jgi:hypothetical protein
MSNFAGNLRICKSAKKQILKYIHYDQKEKIHYL